MPRKPKKLRAGQAGSPVAERRGNGNLPLWRSVVRSLEKDIVSGRLAAGSRLPTETTLARQFGVNRHTLRRAIAELVKKGLVRSGPQTVAQTGGSFVAPLRIPFLIVPLAQISDAIEQAGFSASARLLSERVCTAPAVVARRLMVAQRTPVIELNMLRLANDVPFAFVTAWLPADRFAGIGKLFVLTGGLRRAIVKAGVPVWRRKSATIISRAGEPSECEQLAVDRGTTLLTLQVTDVDAADEPIAELLYRLPAMRTEFLIEG